MQKRFAYTVKKDKNYKAAFDRKMPLQFMRTYDVAHSKTAGVIKQAEKKKAEYDALIAVQEARRKQLDEQKMASFAGNDMYKFKQKNGPATTDEDGNPLTDASDSDVAKATAGKAKSCAGGKTLGMCNLTEFADQCAKSCAV